MSGPPPMIQLCTAQPDDAGLIRVLLTIDGKAVEFQMPRHVAAGAIERLAKALAK